MTDEYIRNMSFWDKLKLIFLYDGEEPEGNDEEVAGGTRVMLHYKLVAETADKVTRIGSTNEVKEKVIGVANRFNDDYENLYHIIPYEVTSCSIELVAMSKRKVDKKSLLYLLRGFVSEISEELNIVKCFRITSFRAGSLWDRAEKNGIVEGRENKGSQIIEGSDYKPESFAESTKIVEHLRNGESVTVNFENVEIDLARKVFDFLAGAVYMQGGGIEKITKDKFTFEPKEPSTTVNCPIHNENKDSMGRAEAPHSALERLNSRIGLQAPKREINNLITLIEYENKYGSGRADIALPRMLFYGNPGVGKSTMAKDSYDVLQEKGVLTGRYVEANRASLCGRYEGHTSPLVKEAFERAKNGLLFVDECHALESKRGDYGAEALNQIVLEMEKRRNETLVIFATYTSEVERVCLANPGFFSRLTAVINFPDYSPEELWEILLQMSIEKGLVVDRKVKETLIPQFRHATKYPEYGAGRYVRSLFEHALTQHAVRVMSMPEEQASHSVRDTLVVEDFF